MNKNVPKLRFKGFEGEWEEKSLGQLLEFKNGVNADKDSYKKGVKFINVLDILNNNYITYDNIIGVVDIDDKILEKYSVNYGDIVFQRSSETREDVGTANVYLDDKAVTFGGFVIRGKKIGEYNPIFMNSLLKSSSARKEITTKSGGSTRYNVGQEILSSVIVKMPSLPEQEKIANFLTKVNSLIEEQDGKVMDLEKYKKGMMQKIFSQEIGFKDDNGCEYPAWKENKILDMNVYISDGNYGEAYPTANDMVDFGIPFLRGNNISNGCLNFDNIKYITSKKHTELTSGHIEFQDIIITVRGDIGKVGFATSKYVGANMNAQLALIRIKDKQINPIYIHQYMNNKEFYKELLKSQTGTALKQLPLNKLKELKIKLPCLEEQTKIANFLFNIDSIIEEEKGKLEELRQWKKGLLQQMFV